MAQLNAAVNEIKALVLALDQKVEARLYDTRPIWEAVQGRLDHVETRLDGIETKLVQFQAEVREQFDYIKHQLEVFAPNAADVRTRQRALDKRVTRLEGSSS